MHSRRVSATRAQSIPYNFSFPKTVPRARARVIIIVVTGTMGCTRISLCFSLIKSRGDATLRRTLFKINVLVSFFSCGEEGREARVRLLKLVPARAVFYESLMHSNRIPLIERQTGMYYKIARAPQYILFRAVCELRIYPRRGSLSNCFYSLCAVYALIRERHSINARAFYFIVLHWRYTVTAFLTCACSRSCLPYIM